MALKISEIAEQAGVNTSAVRYYEDIGLLPRAERQEGGQRRYTDADARRLIFIRRCRDFGFGIEQTRQLVDLTLDRSRSCTEARDIAQAHLVAVRAKLAELKALERSIAAFVHTCDDACAGSAGPDCVVLGQMAEPIGREVKRTRASA